jgi:small GTP-binding protein
MSNRDSITSEEDDEIKVILVGEMATGKTSLINTAIGLEFQEKVPSTTSNSIMNKTVEIEGKPYTVNLWDTIGQEKYRALTKIFMKDAKIIIYVYDITNLHSFNELKFWFEFTKEVINDDTVLAVVGNKSDLFLKELVKEEEGKKLAKEMGYEFALTTAKNPIIFCKFLEKLVEMYITRKEEGVNDSKNTSQRIRGGRHKHKKKCCG